MLGKNYSNSNQSESSQFQMKKVQFKGQVDQESDSNQSQDQSKQKEQQNVTKTAKDKETKTKTIKKNCVSAKLSRQKKKLRIQFLEKKAEQYKEQIKRIKGKVQAQQQSIMSIICNSNPQKHEYLKEKLSQSKTIAQMIVPPNPQKNSPLLSTHIQSFLYKFGSNGILRKDVIQLQKQRWYQLSVNEKIVNSNKPQATKHFSDFNNCIGQLDDKSRRMEYLIRNLKSNIKLEYVGKFLIDKVFLTKNTPDQ